MSIETSVVAYLQADATIVAAATGGIYDAGTIGRSGITRATLPNAFDENKLLKPTVLVRDLTAVNAGVRDSSDKTRFMNHFIEVLIYIDGSKSISLVSSLVSLIEVYLDFARVSGAGYLQLDTLENDQRDSLLSNALFARRTFRCLTSSRQ